MFIFMLTSRELHIEFSFDNPVRNIVVKAQAVTSMNVASVLCRDAGEITRVQCRKRKARGFVRRTKVVLC
jgi:hypothetical protein